jgi:hypothetical protein
VSSQLQEEIEVHRVLKVLIKQTDGVHGVDPDQAPWMRYEVWSPRKKPMCKLASAVGEQSFPFGTDIVAGAMGKNSARISANQRQQSLQAVRAENVVVPDPSVKIFIIRRAFYTQVDRM